MTILELLNSKKSYSIEDFKEFFKDYDVKVTSKWDFMMLKYAKGIDPNSFIEYEWLKECRGSIFRKNNSNWEFVCRPFDKFFNEHEAPAAKLSGDLVVQEKIDGSLLKIYFCNGWKLATNGCIDAFDAKIQDSEKSYGDLAIGAVENFRYLFAELNRDYTYMFEIVSPETKIVIDYPETKIYYLGSRDNVTGKECYDDDVEFSDYGIAFPAIHNITSLEKAKEVAKNLGEDREGFVVRDKEYNRVKVKSLKYLELHHKRDKIWTIKNMFDAWRADTFDDVDTDKKELFYKVIYQLKAKLNRDIKAYSLSGGALPYERPQMYCYPSFVYNYANRNESAEEWIKALSYRKFEAEFRAIQEKI